MSAECLCHLLERARIGNGHDLGPRNHRLFDRGLGKFENLIDQALFFFVQVTTGLGYPDKLPDLVLGVAGAVFARRMKSKKSYSFCSRPIEQPYRIIEDP